MQVLSIILKASLALFGFWLLSFLYQKARYEILVRKLGCSKPVQYPHKDPIFGLDLFRLHVKAIKEGQSLEVQQQIFSQYGKTVQTIVLGKRQYLTMDSRNIQCVLATNADNFGNEPMNRTPSQPFIGDGIITMDGASWKRSRQLINPIFARAQISELTGFDSHVQQLLRLIPCDGSTVDMQPLLKMLFLDSSTEFIFGRSANSLLPEITSDIARQLPKAFDEALRGMRKRFMLGKLRFLAGGHKAWLAKCAEVHSIIDRYINDEIERQKSTKTVEHDTDRTYVLLEELVRNNVDKQTIRNELLNIFFPGRDTAAVTTGNALFLLARHPKVWGKLREEVSSIGSKELSFELLKSMKYTQSIIHETLRVLTPVDRSWKTCVTPTVLPHGGGARGDEPILVVPGDQMNLAFSSMHVDPQIWGSDAADFRPERWTGLKQSWEYIPFLGGRRTCPAQQQVLTEIAFVLTRLAQKFDRCENRDVCDDYVEERVFTKESRNGIRVAFQMCAT
ncbi:MAG: hypothetical protein Q9227_006692 [Pyrenula ochraceoflavens]